MHYNKVRVAAPTWSYIKHNKKKKQWNLLICLLNCKKSQMHYQLNGNICIPKKKVHINQ
jgi:hypothetical protein